MKYSDKIKKALAYGIPFLVLVSFILVLTSGSFIRAYSETGRTFPEKIEQLEFAIVNESWNEAESKLHVLEQQWKKMAPLLQISTTEMDIKQLTQSITSLKGYIRGKEFGLALSEIGLIKFTWNQLGT